MKKSVDFIVDVCYNSSVSSEFFAVRAKKRQNKNKILYQRRLES